MNELERIIESMDFQYFATAQHKTDPESFLKQQDAVLLDLRSKEETETLRFPLKHHISLLEIPMHEVPSRINGIPKNRLLGVFCSSGVRCVMIFLYLKSRGYDKVKILEGGYNNLISVLMPGKIYKHLNNN